MYNRSTKSEGRHKFIGDFSLLIAIVIVLSFAYAVLPTEMSAARGVIDFIQFVTMVITMGYVFKAIIK